MTGFNKLFHHKPTDITEVCITRKSLFDVLWDGNAILEDGRTLIASNVLSMEGLERTSFKFDLLGDVEIPPTQEQFIPKSNTASGVCFELLEFVGAREIFSLKPRYLTADDMAVLIKLGSALVTTSNEVVEKLAPYYHYHQESEDIANMAATLTGKDDGLASYVEQWSALYVKFIVSDVEDPQMMFRSLIDLALYTFCGLVTKLK